MPSSAGSTVFVLAALVLITTFVLLLLRHFLPLRSTPAFLTVPVFLALVLPISAILLVPIDLTSSLRSHGQGDDEQTGHPPPVVNGIWLPDRVILVAWRIAYWLTFALTWLVLPLLGEFVDSGYRTPRDRVLYSLRANGRYQLIVLSCGVVGLVYVFLQNGFHGTSVKALVMALAYCWGLVLAIYLMGHGLVAVPRRLFRNGNLPGKLRRLELQAPTIKSRLEDATVKLDELEGQVVQLRQRKNGISRDHQEWIEDIADLSNMPGMRVPSSPSQIRTAPIPAVITDRYLAELSRKLNRARHMYLRFSGTWADLVQEVADTQAVLDASGSKHLEFGKPPQDASIIGRAQILTPYLRYLVHAHVIPWTRMAFAVIFSLASVSIVWSECVKLFAPRLSLISLTVVSYREPDDASIRLGGQLMASLWLFYMCIAALASFDEVKVWGNRALVRRNTYGESATFYSSYVARLLVPLAYNFLTFLPRDVQTSTTFYQFLGRLINLTPLGKGFDFFFPILILIPVCAAIFNLYGKVKNIFKFGIFEDEDGLDSGARGWREGRDLIDQELNGSSRLGLSTQHDEGTAPTPGSYSDAARVRDAWVGESVSANSSRPPSTPARQAQRLADATQAAEEEDENIFQGFAHRVKNTFDSVERPDWLPELGKRPKWMGGVQGNQDGSGRAESGRGLGRWFGGRPADGHVRL